MNKGNMENIRHSLAHLLAASVLHKFPDTKLGIGPVIENGFYYDFLFKKPITPEMLPELEKYIRYLINQKLPFSGKKVTPAAAKKLFKDQPFKLDLIKDFAKEKKPLTVYSTGEIFQDLCKGGHVKNTSAINAEAFKLTHLAGAYWKGSEKNAQLTRIYAVAFETKKELDDYLKMQEEAKKRDHKILGPKLGIFMFHETSPGMPYWLPKGVTLMNELINFWREEHKRRGYFETSTPLINKKELWITSGHWEHYKENMFIANMGPTEIYGVKAMNCPNAMVIFGSESRSYRDLPLRFSDTDILHRYELSGTLNGLLRARSFRQDDSHNFVTEKQIEEEYGRILDITKLFYEIFGLTYRLRLGTRPEKFLGDIKTWNKAEKALKNILAKKAGKRKYEILEGDGAFYGPKIDILMNDSLGREWQMGTIQLDFQQPARFKLKYADKDGKQKTPVAIHRVIYGSLERFIGILIEHFAGAFPVWLAPVQVRILPVSDKFMDYAEGVKRVLEEKNIRVELPAADETLGKRIRQSELDKIPYTLVVGEKEMTAKTVNVRTLKGGTPTEVSIENFLVKIEKQIKEKAL